MFWSSFFRLCFIALVFILSMGLVMIIIWCEVGFVSMLLFLSYSRSEAGLLNHTNCNVNWICFGAVTLKKKNTILCLKMVESAHQTRRELDMRSYFKKRETASQVYTVVLDLHQILSIILRKVIKFYRKR